MLFWLISAKPGTGCFAGHPLNFTFVDETEYVCHAALWQDGLRCGTSVLEAVSEWKLLLFRIAVSLMINPGKLCHTYIHIGTFFQL